MVTCPRPLGFRSAKQILVVSFATQPRAFILSDRNIFYIPPGGGRTTAGSNAPGAFLVSNILAYYTTYYSIISVVSSSLTVVNKGWVTGDFPRYYIHF